MSTTASSTVTPENRFHQRKLWWIVMILFAFLRPGASQAGRAAVLPRQVEPVEKPLPCPGF